ncbi:hypothetical protein [Pseudooctadecabacter sp.]|uniref:hypothetical protein n=1 Tax=Pseudooctadecabacter sp. TaxID=1966338 RepID=UPI0035C87B91
MNDDRARQTEQQRRMMVDLVFATMDQGQGRQVLNWRIEAKSAHSALLTRATFREDDWAKGRAAELVQSCTTLLIS